MDYNIVFKTSMFNIQFIWLLIPFVMLAFGLCFTKILKFYEGFSKIVIPIRHRKWIIMIWSSFVAVFCVITIFAVANGYYNIVVPYQKGDYKVIEGKVENYNPMPYEGHKLESFEVNGIQFEYSDFTVSFGYHHAASHGGVISKNGMNVKIGYVEYNHKNEIVQIEVKDIKNQSTIADQNDSTNTQDNVLSKQE